LINSMRRRCRAAWGRYWLVVWSTPQPFFLMLLTSACLYSQI
jgi:hypothetical protein